MFYLINTFFIFVLISGLSAKVIKHQTIKLQQSVFTLKEACQQSGHPHVLLVEALDYHTFDCMGDKVRAYNFCRDKFKKSTNLLRGFVDISQEKVVCERGYGVKLSLSCDKRDKKYCKELKSGCNKLKKSYAADLELLSFSKIKNNLNCYYSIKENFDRLNF